MNSKRLVGLCLFVFSMSLFSQAQSSVTELVGKPMNDPAVVKFIADNNLDAATGLSYSKGIQIFTDGTTLYEIYLFNKTSLNGNEMSAYQGTLPFQLSFKDTEEALKKKMNGEVSSKGDHLMWDVKTYTVEVAFTDEKKTEVLYVTIQKK